MYLAPLRSSLRPCAIAALLVALSACSIAPHQPSTERPQRQVIADNFLLPVLTPGMTPRQRIADIAEQEWRRWGSQTVQLRADGQSCIVASALPPPPEYIAAEASDKDATLIAKVSPCWRFADGNGMEATPQGCELALRYWHILGREPGCDQIATARWAWSAVFISWVMRQAGLTDEQFQVSEAHNLYVADARDGVLPMGAFGIEAWPALPQAGDMICSARDAGEEISRVEQIVAGHTPMHCDVVIAVDLQARTLKAIGGNVQQAVSLSTIAWGAPSVPSPLSLPGADPAIEDKVGRSAMPWLLVMRNRLP